MVNFRFWPRATTLLKNKRYLRRSRRNIISRIYHEFVRSRSKKLHCTNHANLVIVFLSCLLFNLFSFLSVFFLFFISFSPFDLFFRHSFIFFPSFCSIFQFVCLFFLSRFLPFVLFSSLFFSVHFFSFETIWFPSFSAFFVQLSVSRVLVNLDPRH